MVASNMCSRLAGKHASKPALLQAVLQSGQLAIKQAVMVASGLQGMLAGWLASM
jgi:hypothetical protein